MTTPIYFHPQPRRYTAFGNSSFAAKRLDVKAIDLVAEQLTEQVGVSDFLAAALEAAGATKSLSAQGEATTAVVVEYRAGLHPQGYELAWEADGLRLACSTAQGHCTYALLTTGQLIDGQKGEEEWAHCLIEDEPDFPVRV
ncbi:hypothetical protein A8709_18220 [Paenibacillus pectinilyticus]|uniref:Beta-hexosaminidase bacterial type N-terminal domain-containing protein n=1 Tax=Paenibacillus pectinilyticus TaxID=512399 RepID=A0A1C0ZZG7_9BACL|nr:glycoside hydrolase family 20 zincin-like fold domain-containing protein [Paenibacillus pectinilyticus]OCT13533.1 hypothetical protein A8709_18220 [Paenibacillus pectinilyticus]